MFFTAALKIQFLEVAYKCCENECCLNYSIVSESGASIYSVSDIAKKELPGLDPSLRGAGKYEYLCHCLAIERNRFFFFFGGGAGGGYTGIILSSVHLSLCQPVSVQITSNLVSQSPPTVLLLLYGNFVCALIMY